jgi:hypothetical protein
MNKWTYFGLGQRLCGALALLVVSGGAAGAQTIGTWTERGFAHINVGNQPGSRTETVAGSFDLYGEVASYGADLRTEGSTVFDIMAGHRVWRNAAVALGYTSYSDTVGTVVGASIPDPLFFESSHERSSAVGGLKHAERAVHLSAAYMLPLSDMPYGRLNRVEVLVFGGPSFFSLDKDVIAGVAVPAGSTDLADVAVNRESGSATGAHFGIDVTYRIASYRFLQGIGAGFFVRGASATIDVPNIEDGRVDVGGLTYGVGARLRF